MSSNNNNNTNTGVHHSSPIPIASARARSRSVSVSSASSGSASPGSDLPTPPSSATGSHRISIPSPSQSPILSYFLSQSPSKPPQTFPFKRPFGGTTSPVFEADEESERELPAAVHARRTSATVANRISGQPPIPEAFQDRGNGLLRRLSLSSAAFTKPQLDTAQSGAPPSPPPNTAVNPTPRNAPFMTKPRRSATISTGERPRRAPSPMGERILKGHFDGFN